MSEIIETERPVEQTPILVEGRETTYQIIKVARFEDVYAVARCGNPPGPVLGGFCSKAKDEESLIEEAQLVLEEAFGSF